MRCNHCWKPIEGDFYITKCSHAFCEADAQKFFSKELVCPACDKPLTAKEIKSVEPNSDKLSCLCGLPPDIAIESCQNAILFWDNQKEAEIRYHEYMNKEISNKLQTEIGNSRETLLSAENQLSVLSSRLETASDEIASQKNEILELQERCNQKSREKSKLQELYTSLKRKYDNKDSTNLHYSKPIAIGVGVESNVKPSLFSRNASSVFNSTKQPGKIEKKSSPSFLQGKKTNSIFNKSQRLLNLQRPKTPNLFNF
eukprot:gene6655-10820_t